MTWHPFSATICLLALTLAIWLSIAVFLHNRQRKVNLLFILYLLAFSSWLISIFLSDSLKNIDAVLFWTKMTVVGPAIVAASMVTISYLFPKPETVANRVLLGIWSLPTIIILLSQTNLFYKSVQIYDWGSGFEAGPLYPLFGIYLLLYISYARYHLWKKARSANEIERANIQLISNGLMITLASGLSFSLVIPMLGYPQLAILTPVASLFLFSAFGYAIIKHRFLDINYLIFRAVSYVLISVTIMALYAGTLFSLPTIVPQINPTYLSMVLGLILVYSYNPLKLLIERFTRGIFYKQPYSSTELLDSIGEILRSTLSLSTITRKVLSKLKSTVGPQSAWFITVGSDGETMRKSGYGDSLPVSILEYRRGKQMFESDTVTQFNDIEEGPKKDILRQYQITVVITLRVNQTTLGFLLLGEKMSGDNYSAQDISVLESLESPLSLAIQNALSFEEISNFNKTLEQKIDQATSDLKKANHHLKRLDKLKDEFVFIATHELKNPVTAMRGYLTMFSEGVFGNIPEKMKDPINQLQGANQQLVDLVNDLLQIARSESKTMTIRTEPVDLGPIVAMIMEGTKPLADQKKLIVTYKSFPTLPQVQGDAGRIKEIVGNLISNAIKYSDRGTITISHEIKADKIITNVADQGVGISEADQSHLFTRFYRVEQEAARGIPGTGLGLFIVKQLVEKMGGTISLTSKKGEGTTFSFSLPRTQ